MKRLWFVTMTFCALLPAGARAQSTTQTLTFHTPKATPFNTRGGQLAALTGCSDDGTGYFLMAASRNPDMVLHSIRADGATTPFEILQVPGYKALTMPRRFFVSGRYVATLVDALPASSDAASADTQFVALVLLYDPDGSFRLAVPVPVGLDVLSFGVYETGDLLLISMDPASRAAVLTVVSQRGVTLRTIPLFDADFNASTGAEKKQPLARFSAAGALTQVQVTAHGGNLILTPAATALPLVEVSESGVVRSYDVPLPQGLAWASLLSSDGVTWYANTWGGLQTHAGGASMQTGPILAFNPADGSIRSELRLAPTDATMVLCEYAGHFLGLDTDQTTGQLELVTGSAPR